MSDAALPPHEHTIEPGEINRRGCRRCEIDREASAAAKVCTPDKCAYGNFCCPNGCKDEVELDAPSAAAQDHAETVRRIVSELSWMKCYATDRERAFAAVDALEAENVRLREALKQITQVWPNRGHAANIAREALYV